jgi:hypothetical protein
MSQRDIRDPIALGDTLLIQARYVRDAYGQDIPLSEVYDKHVSHFGIRPYDSGQYISADPKDHHSKVQQNIDWQEGADVAD